LVLRLRSLAASIAASAASTPRWIFLVGGPGNGKSETVQDFLVTLDEQLGLKGALKSILEQRFRTAGLLPRKVEVTPSDLGDQAGVFASKVGRLLVIQDATATEVAMGNAAKELADDIADLITSPGPPLPVFVACANRGLLARAMNEAYRSFGPKNDVTSLLSNVIQASSLGRETLAGRKPCWPLESDSRFACWPLDVESLFAGSGPHPPADQMLTHAVDLQEWEVIGRCGDCSSRETCPFRQNANWLREDATRSNLLTMLRRGQFARGQRWNFRDAFSLIAELVVGQWSDFGSSSHPCAWVHLANAAAGRNPPRIRNVVALALQLYPHAFFKGSQVQQTAQAFLEGTPVAQGHPITKDLLDALASTESQGSRKPIRDALVRDYARLDPATYTPVEPSHPLRLIEEAYCQSVEQGRASVTQPAFTPIESLLMDTFDKAEQEWNLLGRDSTTATAAVCVLRKLACMFAKRTVGIRLGHHAIEELLAEYEACLRDGQKLGAVRNALQPLLGETAFKFNLLEILGQPTAEGPPLVALQEQPPGARPLPAPVATSSAPGHDVPCIEISDPNYRIPLTFEFYLALRLRKDGCAGSSLPASVRAALDRVRHRYAGERCRNEDRFVDGRALVVFNSGETIGIAAAGAIPGLVQE
jgi:hypothetical protein